jgi:CHRD domain
VAVLQRRRGIHAPLAAVLACLVLAGCAQFRADEGELYGGSFSAAQEVPPVASPATGDAEVRYDPKSALVHWRVTHAGLSGPVTGAHIHGPAGPGQNAGIVIPFGNPSGQPITGQARITPEQLGQLSSGQWYVNLHTARHPAGEIRAQLRPRR